MRLDQLPDIIARARAIDEARVYGNAAFGPFPLDETLDFAWAIRVLADRERSAAPEGPSHTECQGCARWEKRFFTLLEIADDHE